MVEPSQSEIENKIENSIVDNNDVSNERIENVSNVYEENTPNILNSDEKKYSTPKFDIDNLVKRIDEKIAQLEAEEKKNQLQEKR